MDNIIKYSLLCIGSLLTIYSIITLVSTNFNFGSLAFTVLGIVFCVLGIFFNAIKEILFFKILMIVIALLFIVYICVCFFIISYGKRDTATKTEDVIIVLGCGINGENVTPQLASRLDAAIEYYKSNETIIVVSGGKGPQEDITEAFAMERYLISKGIPKDKILKEEESTSTYTNLVNSKKILDGYFGSAEYNSVIITSNYHIYRAQKIADDVGLNATHLHSNLNWFEVPIRCLRENLAIAKYWLDRIF